MATDKDPKLRINVLCTECRSPLVTTLEKVNANLYDLEMHVDRCATCKPDHLELELVEVILNGSERVEVEVYQQQ